MITKALFMLTKIVSQTFKVFYYTKRLSALCIVLIYSNINIFADVISTSGVIQFDSNNDSTPELILNSTGLSIGTNAASSNLHVTGNVIIENGNLAIGSSSANSTLEITGTIGFGTIQLVSGNITLSDNSIALIDTSAANLFVRLPYAANVMGRLYTIKKISHQNTLFLLGGGNYIDQSPLYEMPASQADYQSLEVISNGEQWYILNQKAATGTSETTSDNLVFWHKYDETSGSTASDSSNRGHSGTLNDITFSGNRSSGVLGGALVFDGANDYISVSDSSNLYFKDTNASFSFWAKCIGSGTELFLDHFTGGSPGSGWNVRVQSNNTMNLRHRGNSGTLSVSTSSAINIRDGNWHHICFTIDHDSLTTKAYLNGTESGSAAFLAPLNDYAGTFYIGAGVASSLYFQGSLDDIRIYNKLLTPDEINALYLTGTP